MGEIQPLRDPALSAFLASSWSRYRDAMIEADGRPKAERDGGDLDKDGNRAEQVTFSEAAAYAMIRASIVGDRAGFEKVWNWTRQNLQRKNINSLWTYSDQTKKWSANPFPKALQDNLFAWRFVPGLNGPDSPGGIISHRNGGDTSGYSAASDDVEIATALFFAHLQGWDQNDAYLQAAREIVGDAWSKYVFTVGDKYYFAAGDQFARSGEVNPSYFRPAYFRELFPLLDPGHPWGRVADTSYEVIVKSGQMALDRQRGSNLPPNWLDVDYNGDLTSSDMFAAKGGNLFGWDSFRTLYGVAQDYAWFQDPTAKAYLTDSQQGPLAFLQGRFDATGGRLPGGFRHDGQRVTGRGEGSDGLNVPQLAMDGAYLSFFHYAGDEKRAAVLRERLVGSYDQQGGYWGKDPNDYFTQNWAWFGLLGVNGLPKELEDKMNAYRLAHRPAAGPDGNFPPSAYKLGKLNGLDLRAQLDRNLVAAQLTLPQLLEAADALTGAGGKPLKLNCDEPSKCAPQFAALARLEDGRSPLLPYLADEREYWNNAVIILSVLDQKISEELTDSEEQSAANARLVEQCQTLRAGIAAQLKAQPEIAPHDYSRILLDLTEADLRSKVPGRDEGYYREGLELGLAVICSTLDSDPAVARPDYYTIAKALITVGDLYSQLDVESRKMSFAQEPDYLNKAAAYYDHAARLFGGTTVIDPELGLYFSVTPTDISWSLNFNYHRGYLNDEANGIVAGSEPQIPPAVLDRIGNGFRYLSASATAKRAALYIRQPGAKEIVPLLEELAGVDEAITALTALTHGTEDYALSFAKTVKADLILALADRVKYRVWEERLPQSSELLDQLDRFTNPASQLPERETALWRIKTLLESPLGTGASLAAWPQLVEKLFAFNDRLMGQARELNAGVPSDFGYLYASANMKLLEIAVRQVEFIQNEASLLRPFYTDPILLKRPFAPGEFVAIEQDYLKALLLVSLASNQKEKGKIAAYTGEATRLLDGIVVDARMLQEPFQSYFLAHAKLKMAVIFARNGQYQKAITLFKEIEPLVQGLEPSQVKMAWRPYSFYAELYHEWANALRATGAIDAGMTYATKALDNCALSDSPYDVQERTRALRHDFYQ